MSFSTASCHNTVPDTEDSSCSSGIVIRILLGGSASSAIVVFHSRRRETGHVGPVEPALDPLRLRHPACRDHKQILPSSVHEQTDLCKEGS